ncbi:putative tricarboxylic transport membrane protein [Desulfuromusa kysingii]|uniref:Putative tricarboxylic transport membrane protein n=1 Tax=Desulfuromusa kysingii TaxID=37625 RepID=A0A1H4DXD1_9BACT|nr:tripartite tricarboxylate transporter substrate-binding protein [Desulfuromusa kysingii]SEA77246.1 putative tricarboxylic transport membrane protein [Desulfuromusa kysingii]
MILLLLTLFLNISNSFAFEAHKTVCMVPAKPGGGLAQTCQLLTQSLFSANLLDEPMSTKYRPGGIGTVAYNYVVGVHNDDPNLIIAASSGSVLNLATHKFGHYTVNDVRWLGALGADYGAIAVRKEAPWNTLDELLSALRKKPLAISGGGSIGSQDWMKMASLVKTAGIDPKTIRYVAFEGGGEALAALYSGHVQVFSGDISDLNTAFNQHQIKVLAVFSPDRLTGNFSTIPTAKEQGYPVEWKIWRGYYMGAGVSDEAYNWWVNSLRRLIKTEEFIQQREQLGLLPLSLIGSEFEQFVHDSIKQYRQLAIDIGVLP